MSGQRDDVLLTKVGRISWHVVAVSGQHPSLTWPIFTHFAPEEQQAPAQHSPLLQQKSGRVLQEIWLGIGLDVQRTAGEVVTTVAGEAMMNA